MTGLHLEPYQWGLAMLGAFLIGVSKTGIAGLGMLFVAIFAGILPPKTSVGIVLPILISADIVAVTAFRRHAVWAHLWRLLPWAALGVLLGTVAAKLVSNEHLGKMIGVIILGMVVVHLGRRIHAARRPDAEDIPDGLAFSITMGVLAGFTTMVANAAGPILILYLLSMRLPKLAFIGTGAWFFLTVNVFKVPFSIYADMMTKDTFLFSALMFPFAITGALCGRAILKHIDQKLFENLALALTILAGLKLLI